MALASAMRKCPLSSITIKQKKFDESGNFNHMKSVANPTQINHQGSTPTLKDELDIQSFKKMTWGLVKDSILQLKDQKIIDL